MDSQYSETRELVVACPEMEDNLYSDTNVSEKLKNHFQESIRYPKDGNPMTPLSQSRYTSTRKVKHFLQLLNILG
jgi:hypothetical protein